MARATWKPHEKHGTLTKRSDLPDSVFAFPKERAEPMTDARHVRNALARFDQVRGASDAERDVAFANIKKAARHYGIDVTEKSWHDLGRAPAKKATRKKPARKKTTRKKTTRKKTSARKKAAPRKKTARKKTTRKKTSARKKSTRKKATRKR
jgi:hypothetical protein